MATRVFEREIELFRQHGGGLRMAEALRLGINRKTLYAMRDAGVVVPVSRGVYRLAALDPLAHPDLVTVAKRVPQGVLCLISALSFHELTTQVPHMIDVALERGKTAASRLPADALLMVLGPGVRRGHRDARARRCTCTHLRPGEDPRRLLSLPEPDRHGRGPGGAAALA